MVEITKKFNIFKIDEISKDAYKKAKEKYEYDMIDFNSDMFENDIEYYIYENYGIIAKFGYSLSYCQGDGLYFETDNILTPKTIDFIKKDLNKKQKFVFDYLVKYGYKFYTKHKNNFYCYASKNDVCDNIDIYAYEYYKNEYPHTKIKHDDFYKTIVKIEDVIQKFYLNLCEKFENDGYESIYFVYSDDDFVALCNENNYYFYENGDFYGVLEG